MQGDALALHIFYIQGLSVSEKQKWVCDEEDI
ncbi:hypothetical protein SCARR_00901 [Pontiella sulfatireligans]|uniref:Uncharacterized protein n=1 Tax=Pontiella sulfatireligans TaxID=2750658 RepID=A0A6C2UFF7_9BACT|nr:hypothetical protein SCARR_00901 [Pontiella sulfatireligans]